LLCTCERADFRLDVPTAASHLVEVRVSRQHLQKGYRFLESVLPFWPEAMNFEVQSFRTEMMKERMK